jgi:hypothetical protein
MKPRKMKAKKMRNGGAPVKKMRGGGSAMAVEKLKKGGTDLTTLRKMAKAKGYKLVKA